MPKDTELAFILSYLLNSIEGIVDAQKLMVFSNDLLQTTFALLKEGEVLNHIQQTGWFTDAPKHGF